MVPDLKPERAAELSHRCAELVRRSVLTLAAVSDPDRRFQSPPKSCLPPSVREVNEAYGWDPPKVRRFQPTARDVDRYLTVLHWLGQLSAEPGGERDVKLLVARAYGTPWWKLAERFRRSEATLKRWQSGAIARLMARHWREVDLLA